VTAYIGQTIRVYWDLDTDVSNITDYYLDDVSLTAYRCL